MIKEEKTMNGSAIARKMWCDADLRSTPDNSNYKYDGKGKTS